VHSRLVKSVALASALLAATATAASGQERKRLEGWGPFKFSMTRLDAIEAVKPNAYFYNSPFIGYDTEIDGTLFHAVVEFTKDQNAITKIRLQKGSIAASFAAGPPKENISKDTCLSRVSQFEPMLTAKYGTPDRTWDYVETISVSKFDHRNVSYYFKDGGHIEIIASYQPAQLNLGGKKNENFCAVHVEYMPMRVLPKSTF